MAGIDMAMTRNQRRKAAAMRKAKAAADAIWQRLEDERQARIKAMPKGRSPKGLGNRNIYQGNWGHIAIGGHRRTYSTPNDQVKGKR